MAYRINLASDLRHRAVIRRMAQGCEKDAFGPVPGGAGRVATVWCSVTPQTGSLLSGRPAGDPAVPDHPQGDHPVPEGDHGGHVAGDRGGDL